MAERTVLRRAQAATSPADEGGQAQQTKGKNRTLLMVIAAVAGSMILGYLFAASNGLAGLKARFEKPQVATIGPALDLGPFVVNVAGTSGERYLKATVTLEVSDGRALGSLVPLKVKMNDAIISILSSQTLKDLESPSSKDKVKALIKDRMNEVIGSPLITQVFFQEFVMQ